LEKKELDEANNWLQTLERRDDEREKTLSKRERAMIPRNSFETVALRAEYHFLRGNYAAAADVAMAFLDNPDAQPSDRPQQLLLVAKVMEHFSDRLEEEDKPLPAKGFGDKADACFASLRRVSKVGDIYFAAHLARQKRTRECLEVLDQCWDKCPAESLQIPAVAMLQSKAVDSAQWQQLEKILVAAANKSNRPVVLLTVLADLYAQLRQDDKSIADYREILAKEPRNYRTMNNLSLELVRSGGNLDEALKLVNDALAIRGPMAEVLDSRAIVYIARQEPEKALEDMALAIRDDGTAEQYFHQAWAYSLAGKKSEAAAAFAVARNKRLDSKKLDPREVSVYDRLNIEL
jgi:tetratricopeptide (TPR) repeat protein